MTQPRVDTCPECGTERHVRTDGTFRLHGANNRGSDRHTCPGSHKPAPNLIAVHYMTDAERLRQIRSLCEAGEPSLHNAVYINDILEILDA
jgi:hypothetical protein